MEQQIHYEKCYVGLPLPQEFLEKYKKILNAIKNVIPDAILEDYNWSHITIYFLGLQTDGLLLDISETIKPTIREIIGTKLKIKGLKHFEDNDPRVLYLDIEDLGGLNSYNGKLCNFLSKYNFQEHKFTPHLTLARLRDDNSKHLYRQNEHVLKEFTKDSDFEFSIDQIQIRGKDPQENLKKKILFSFK